MELIKITDLTTQMGLSSRTLRYYEQVGLITSIRPEFEKYRYFDEKNIERLKQIMVLRKMNISIHDIQRIYQSEDMSVLVETFVNRINQIDKEVTALTELKQIIDSFLHKMLQNGIKKISALPLLYEEVSKQLGIVEDNHSISIKNLNDISKQLRNPVDVRIVKLPKMNMICSKKIDSDISDVDGFWSYLDRNGLLNSFDGHSIFEYQDNNEQTVVIAKKTDMLCESSYSEFFFEGGLYAVSSAYADEDIDSIFQSIIKSFDDNKFYEVNYKRGTRTTLIESVLSPDGQRNMVDVFVPLKSRLPDASYFKEGKLLADITVEEIEQANPILQRIDVEKFKPIDDPYYRVNENGETEYISFISIRTLSTEVEVKIPFRVDIEFKVENEGVLFQYGTDEGSIRIDYGNMYFGINMDNNPDKRFSQ